MPDTSPQWSDSATDDTPAPVPAGDNASSERMLEALERARFRMSRRAVSSYDVDAVDTIIDALGSQAGAGEDVLPTLRSVKFPMSQRGVAGYQVDDVDNLLLTLNKLANQDVKGSRPGRPESAGPTGRKVPVGVIIAALLVLVVLVILVTVLL